MIKLLVFIFGTIAAVHGMTDCCKDDFVVPYTEAQKSYIRECRSEVLGADRLVIEDRLYPMVQCFAGKHNAVDENGDLSNDKVVYELEKMNVSSKDAQKMVDKCMAEKILVPFNLQGCLWTYMYENYCKRKINSPYCKAKRERMAEGDNTVWYDSAITHFLGI